MKKIYFLLPIILFLFYEIAFARIKLRDLIVTYDYYGKPRTMHIMATNTRGTSMRPKYSANIYCSPHYGYYEVFMCASWNTPYTTGCLHEIVTEESFRFVNVGKPDFSWFIDKFTHHERSLVNTTRFELCIVDGTLNMRKSFMRRILANLGQRIKMPRYCWVIQLEYRSISNNTLLEMERATKLELLKGKREKLYKYKKQFDERINAEKKFFDELQIKLGEHIEKEKELLAENERLKAELQKDHTNININIHNSNVDEINQNAEEARKQINILDNTVDRIKQISDEGEKSINNLKEEVVGLENKIIGNNNVVIVERNIMKNSEQANKLDKINPAHGLSEEERKKMERYKNLKLNIRKKRNANPNKKRNIKQKKKKAKKTKKMSNNKLISDKTNGKLKEIGMIMDNQDPAFDHSTLEELDKKRQDMGKIWKKHGIENELEIKDLAPAFDHSTLEELDKKRQDMGKIWKKHGIENELEIKDLAPAFDHSTLEELDKKRQDMGKIWKKHGIENELEIKDLAPAFDHSTLEELDKKRQDMGKIWTKHEIKDELEAVKEKNDYLIRSKRNVDDDIIWEILSKIVPRKQAMLFNMASNDLLTVGSIEFDDYQNEIATITNVNAEQLLDYDVKDFENLKESFGKEIFYKIAPKRMEKIIRDAEDKFENVLGIYSALKMVEKDNKEIDETIQNIEEAEEKLKTEGVSVDDYCKKECTALSEYDEKIANEIEKEKNKQEIKKEVKGKEEHKDRIKEIKRHPEAEEMKETDKEKGEERHTKTGEMKESDIIESEIEHQEQPPEAIHNTNGVLSKVYNKSKEHMGNVAKFVGNKSWEIASHIGNKVVQASSNAWSKKTENTSKIGGSSQKLETPGTSKEPKETNKGDKGKGIEEIVESEIEDQGVQLEASGHSEGALSKIYNKSKENLGNVGKYVGKKSWEIASHYGNKLVQTAINTMTRKSENTKPENTSQIVGSDQPTAKIPGTAHIRLGHQIYQRKTEEPK